MKDFADHNSKFNENRSKFSKRVENTVGKGEIARCEQFLLFPRCFQKASTTDTLKKRLVWKRVKMARRRSESLTTSKSFDPYQSAQFAQADKGRNSLLMH